MSAETPRDHYVRGVLVKKHGSDTIDFEGLTDDEREEHVTDDVVVNLLDGAVKNINLTGCRRITNNTMDAIARWCPSLESLNVADVARQHHGQGIAGNR